MLLKHGISNSQSELEQVDFNQIRLLKKNIYSKNNPIKIRNSKRIEKKTATINWLTTSGGTRKADINNEIKHKIFRLLQKLETSKTFFEYKMHIPNGIWNNNKITLEIFMINLT